MYEEIDEKREIFKRAIRVESHFRNAEMAVLKQ